MTDILTLLRGVIASTPFDSWMGLELVEAGEGSALVRLTSRADLLQQSGFLHAGVIAAMIDRAAGFAAASLVGAVLTCNFQVTPYRPAVGEIFEARAQVVRAGKTQAFVNVELFAIIGDSRKLAAGGTAVLTVIG